MPHMLQPLESRLPLISSSSASKTNRESEKGAECDAEEDIVGSLNQPLPMAETATPSITENHPSVDFENDEECEKLGQECKELVLSLPREKGGIDPYLYLYKDTWLPAPQIQAIRSFQKDFQATDDDIVIATLPKSGTTWLKALTFAIVNRKVFSPSQNHHPLLVSIAHELIESFEFVYYANNQIPDLSDLPKPRIFSTHVPLHLLADSSVVKSKCKIIYICRNPFDNFVSLWIFANKIKAPSLPKLSSEEALDMYSKGIIKFGPFWTNMLGYWRESKQSPNKILFLRYEDLKGDTKFYVKRVAEFLECPFNSEEERDGVIDNIIELCSFQKMKRLEVNQTGKLGQRIENNAFFRKGEVGDWVNHFNPSMAEKLSKVMREKLGDSGLSF